MVSVVNFLNGKNHANRTRRIDVHDQKGQRMATIDPLTSQEFKEAIKDVLRETIEQLGPYLKKVDERVREVPMKVGKCFIEQILRQDNDFVIEKATVLERGVSLRHQHNTTEHLLVVKGSVYVKYNDDRHYKQITVGNSAVIPKNTYHYVIFPEPAILVVVLIPDDGEFAL